MQTEKLQGIQAPVSYETYEAWFSRLHDLVAQKCELLTNHNWDKSFKSGDSPAEALRSFLEGL
jgi:hypothetical protein